jgi:hypothetical protein
LCPEPNYPSETGRGTVFGLLPHEKPSEIDTASGLLRLPTMKAVNKSKKLRIWLSFGLWLTGVVVCGVIDHLRQSSLLLSIYLPVAAIVVVFATRKQRLPDYKFEVVKPGVVRSQQGFEIRVSNRGLEYVELDHRISWHPTNSTGGVARFNFSEQSVDRWNPPFAAEPISSKKKG